MTIHPVLLLTHKRERSSGSKLLWMAPFTFPLMAAMQGMCARIGLVTSQGLTNTLKKHYPPLILWRC